MRSVQEIQSAFMRMDVNGDGSLTKREMLAADEFTPEEIEAIFDLGDVDGDGTVDMDEFVGTVKQISISIAAREVKIHLTSRVDVHL